MDYRENSQFHKDINIEGDGVYGDITDEELQHLMRARKERYTEGINKPVRSEKTVSAKLMITIVCALFAYYITAFVLNLTGILTSFGMLLMMAPVTIVVIVIYLLHKRN